MVVSCRRLVGCNGWTVEAPWWRDSSLDVSVLTLSMYYLFSQCPWVSVDMYSFFTPPPHLKACYQSMDKQDLVIG